MSNSWKLALASIAVTATVAACGTPGVAGDSGDAGVDGEGPVKVGLVYSKSGLLATYGAQYKAAFDVGLDYATDGTGEVDGRKIEVVEKDDAGDPAKAVSAVTGLIGQDTKIIAGSTASGVALQVAPLAQDNKVLFISGPAAVDGITGVNDYTFRSGRQTYQDVATAGTMLGDVKGKKVTVLAQDSAFGKANIDAVKQVLGEKGALELVHRVTAISSGGFDALPHNGAVITLLAICGLSHRQSYKDIAVVAIVVPVIALIAIIVLGTIFGGF